MKSTYKTSNKVIAELQRLATKHHGLLDPKVVVNAARDKTSVLHKHFEWDNTKAAEQWRLRQAQELIRVSVTYLSEEDTEPTKVFVSLSTDRGNGGYRRLSDVMSSKKLRTMLLKQAYDEMLTFENRYKQLTELATVMDTISKTKTKLANKFNWGTAAKSKAVN